MGYDNATQSFGRIEVSGEATVPLRLAVDLYGLDGSKVSKVMTVT